MPPYRRFEVQIPGWVRSTQPFIPSVSQKTSTKFAWELKLGVSHQTYHLTRTAHVHKVMKTEMDTVFSELQLHTPYSQLSTLSYGSTWALFNSKLHIVEKFCFPRVETNGVTCHTAGLQVCSESSQMVRKLVSFGSVNP
ncbi:hypothetical protein TNCV_3664941 [Trichonephila clavipes]|nr:hypothetical protein TNCV_3664941 [Trichonephila clavipes]